MKPFILFTLLSGLLSIALSSAVLRRDDLLTYAIVPPLNSQLCDRSWDQSIAFNIDPGSSHITDKCNMLNDYITSSKEWAKTKSMHATYSLICPTGPHYTVYPPAPPVSANAYPARFIFGIADPTFPANEVRMMSTLNVTDASHDPPVDIYIENVMIEYQFDAQHQAYVRNLICW